MHPVESDKKERFSMHRIKIGLLALLITPFSVIAGTFLSTNTYETVAEQEQPAEQWVSCVDATIAGTHQQDLFLAAGQSITISGTLEGDLWATGTKIDFSGVAEQNMRLAGGTVQINGPVKGNIMLLGDTVTIRSNAILSGDVTILAQSVVMEGEISGNCKITAVRIATLDGLFGGNLEVTSNEILIKKNTLIEGNLMYTAPKELFLSDDKVQGNTQRVEAAPPTLDLADLQRQLLFMMAALLVGLPVVSLFPFSTAMGTQIIRQMPGRSFLLGLALMFGMPFLALTALSSWLGIPMGLLLLAVWGILIYISRIVVALFIGSLIYRTRKTGFPQVLITLTIGLLVIYAALIIPSPQIKMGLQISMISIGSGALLIALIQKRKLILRVPEELSQIEKMKKQQQADATRENEPE